jgi:hypothetical protein
MTRRLDYGWQRPNVAYITPSQRQPDGVSAGFGTP